jgi:biopolymer transport protein ExbB
MTALVAAGPISAYAADQAQNDQAKEPTQQEKAAKSLDQLLQQVREARSAAAAANKQREQEFLANRDQQKQKLQAAKEDYQRENARSDRLKAQFDQNEKDLTQLNETLQTRTGNLGEVFGVVRQVAGDTKSVIDNSLVSAQFPDRGQELSKLAQSKALPSIDELEQLWYILQQEMTESGKIVKFPATIVRDDGTQTKTDVVRVGVFDAIVGDKFLKYLPETNSLVVLPRQPAGRFRDMADDLYSASAGSTVAMAVDPSRGSLLGQLIQTPTFVERVQQGQLIGYLTIILGCIGVLIAIERLIYLLIAGRKIKGQLGAGKPSPDNALGRILSVYTDNKEDDLETLELKLDEAIMKETPALEARQGTLKIIAAVAPLMGLLGTVTGMIQTFQSITLFGTGDPKLMANGISQALVTTVIGLCVAIPMVLLHSFVASRSKELVQILEEQSAGLIAEHAEKRK